MNRAFYSILLILCFFSPLVFKSGIFDYANSVKLAFLQFSTVTLLVIWVCSRVTDRQFLFRKSPFTLPLLFLFLLLTLSACLAGNKYEAFKVWQHWTAAILCFFMVLNGLRDHKQIDTLLAVLFASGVFVALVGICQYLLGLTFVPQTVSPAATFGNKNMAAQYVMLTLPFGLYFLLCARHMALVWSSGLATVLMAVFLVYTGTRGAWLSCVAELVLFIFFLTRRPWIDWPVKWSFHKSWVVCAATVLFLIFVNIGPQGFQYRLNQLWGRVSTVSNDLETSQDNGQSTSGSVGIRLAIWRNTLEMIKDNPLVGVGLANHKINYPLYHRKILQDRQFSEKVQLVHVHNDYLQFVSEVGVGGAVLLLWLAWVSIVALYRMTSVSRAGPLKWRVGIIGMSLAGLAANACVSFPMQIAVPPFFLMILLALLAFQLDEKKVTYAFSRGWSLVVLIMSALVFVWVSVYQMQQLVILRHFFKMINFERQANWDGIIQEYQLASRYVPGEKRLLFFLAEAHLFRNENQQAVQEFEEYLGYYPYSINALRNLGVSYSRQNRKDKALEAYERYLVIFPDSSAVNAYRNRLLRK